MTHPTLSDAEIKDYEQHGTPGCKSMASEIMRLRKVVALYRAYNGEPAATSFASHEEAIEAWRKDMLGYCLALHRDRPIPGRGGDALLDEAVRLMRGRQWCPECGASTERFQ